LVVTADEHGLGSGASRAAIEHHYDVGGDFYRLWLDQRMVYSCALWDGPFDDDLETAQLAKLAWHVSAARAEGAKRVLDVGCGWGAMLRYLTAECGVGHATGLTLSSDQASVAAASLPSSVEVRLEDWREHRPAGLYDAIVSMGAFEHFSRPDLDTEERREVYSAFFEACAGWLRGGGRLSLQTIAYEDFDPSSGVVASFFTTDIFPESTLPLLTDIVEASDPWFAIVRLRSDPQHYEHTLHVWQRRLEANRSAAIDLVGQATYRRYVRYLRVARAMFDRRVCTLYRIALERRPQAVRRASRPTTRDGG
jgi:cyclopropane-fatty-acyl-phospholipid synthase